MKKQKKKNKINTYVVILGAEGKIVQDTWANVQAMAFRQPDSWIKRCKTLADAKSYLSWAPAWNHRKILNREAAADLAHAVMA